MDINGIIEDNMGLVYMQLHKFNLAYDDDAKSEAMVGLWNAAKTFDPSSGNKFSTYAAVCIYNAIAGYLRPRLNKRTLGSVVSYDEFVFEDTTYLETMPAFMSDPEEQFISNEICESLATAIEEVVDTMSPNAVAVIRYWQEHDFNVKQKDIAKATGVSQPTVARTISVFKYRLRLKMEGIIC